MKKYYRTRFIVKKTGEDVFVSDHPEKSGIIIVEYKGKCYEKPSDIIGKTLLPIERPVKQTVRRNNKPNKNTVKIDSVLSFEAVEIGSRVTIKPLNGDECEYYEIVAPSISYEYTGMGGSYYGAHTKMKKDIKRYKNDRYFKISTESGLAKRLLGMVDGTIFETPDENGDLQTYVITDVKNQK